jgi:hypothetical protein
MAAVVHRSIVEDHHNNPGGPPTVVPNTKATATDICELVLLFLIFGTLFATDLKSVEAGNQFEALVVQFLGRVEKIGYACRPDKKQSI